MNEGKMASSHRRGADDRFPGHGRILDEDYFHRLRSGEDDRRTRRVIDGAGIAAANAKGGEVDGYDDDGDGGLPPPSGAGGGSRGGGG
jgi:hypothetical protein